MHVQKPNQGTCLKRALFPSLEPRGLSGTIWWGPIFGRGAAWSPKLRLCSNRWVLSAPGSSNPYIFAQQLSQWQAITRGQNQAWEVILSQLLSGEQNFLHTFLLFQQITLMTFSTSSKTYHLFRRESEIDISRLNHCLLRFLRKGNLVVVCIVAAAVILIDLLIEIDWDWLRVAHLREKTWWSLGSYECCAMMQNWPSLNHINHKIHLPITYK